MIGTKNCEDYIVIENVSKTTEIDVQYIQELKKLLKTFKNLRS